MYYIYAFFYCKKIQKIQNIVHNLQKFDIMIMVGTYCNVSVQKRGHTMKYKVLLSGRNKIIMNEFFSYMDFSFECLSCSERYDDIVNHLKYIHPDVFVYCLRGENPDDLKKFCNIGRKIEEEKIPLVVIGDDEDCELFEKVTVVSRATILSKPITSQNIEAEVLKLLNGRKMQENDDTEAPIAVALKVLERMEIPVTTESSVTAESPVMAESSDTAKPSVRKHILVVDDDSSVLKLIKGHLAEQYDVATAISGKVAMKFLETKRTDLILMDYEMPGENGVDVLNKIRCNEKLKNLPVVFLTGVSEREKIQEVLALRPQGYLLKPIDMERLSVTIESLMA